MLGCAPMTGDSVECFNCGRSNPSWAQVCRSCGVPMRPGGAGARPPSGPLPTDRDSLISMGAGLAVIGLAIVFGLLLSGILPEAAAVIETPTPGPSASVLPSASVAPSASAKPTPRPTPELIGTVTFGFGLNQSTREAIDITDTFALGDSFCHSVALPQRFGVSSLQEEILKIEEDGSLTIVQRRREGTLPGIDPNAHIAGFCVSADALINGINGSDGWGTGDFVLRDYRRKGSSPELLAQGTFTLTE
jgi:hypothetical protein